jgi:hypothetical protein
MSIKDVRGSRTATAEICREGGIARSHLTAISTGIEDVLAGCTADYASLDEDNESPMMLCQDIATLAHSGHQRGVSPSAAECKLSRRFKAKMSLGDVFCTE